MIKDSDEIIRKEVHALYQHIEQEQPPQALDQKILNLAAANAKPKLQSQSFWRKHRWPLSSAASVLMVVTLFVINPQIETGNLSDEAMPTLMMTPQDSPAPAMMRMASPEVSDIEMSADNSTASSSEAPLLLPSNGFSDNTNSAADEAANQELISRLDKVSELINRKDYGEAEHILLQIENDYRSILVTESQLSQRFSELETQLKKSLEN
ncbi:hypothetical protein JK628_07350 [Shewanella sp. KX20019]|uniref:hypothetical protein n=1 Tax=Shewanella sp. KX20019 TaxID=2803864 RepID=UPI001925462D|nr:hypothetical protein [Shewanella sp. KX20019]QQX81646.1 hypothetical protein JK628_07350 [Shewanella sp. KX20019]